MKNSVTGSQERVPNLVDEDVQVPDKTLEGIRLLSEIARANRTLLSLKDIVELTRIDRTEGQLEANWPGVPSLAKLYEVSNGFLEERGRQDDALHHRRLENRARAWKYTRFAREFAPSFKSGDTSLIAISGSTSYQSVSLTDDLDFFCVTRSQSVWIFLAKALVLSRIFSLFRRNVPRVCFSYTVDQGFADHHFASSRDALFARDALNIMVVFGNQCYNRLLRKNSWIAGYFPRLYQQRTKGTIKEEREEDSFQASPARRFLNLFLYYTVGNYVFIKSSLLNRKYRRQSRLSSQFVMRYGPNHCIFESARYSQLRTTYKQFDSGCGREKVGLASAGGL